MARRCFHGFTGRKATWCCGPDQPAPYLRVRRRHRCPCCGRFVKHAVTCTNCTTRGYEALTLFDVAA